MGEVLHSPMLCLMTLSLKKRLVLSVIPSTPYTYITMYCWSEN